MGKISHSTRDTQRDTFKSFMFWEAWFVLINSLGFSLDFLLQFPENRCAVFRIRIEGVDNA